VVSKKINPCIGILTGPTASGKTQIALEWAEQMQGELEIINADSLQVYRSLNIGTAKPPSEILKKIPHHLIDILDPTETFTAGAFLRAVKQALFEIHTRGKRALIVGGTGFYLKALLYGIWDAKPDKPKQENDLKLQFQSTPNETLFSILSEKDPISAARIGVKDRYRLIRALEIISTTGKTPTQHQASHSPTPDPLFQVWIIDRDPYELSDRIRKRTQNMLREGIIEEYEKICARIPNSRALNAVGYAQIGNFLKGIPPSGRKINPGLEGLSEEIQLATRQLVKRQRTWFKSQLHPSKQIERIQLDHDKDLLEKKFKKIYRKHCKNPLFMKGM
jgi:tRNA dimethylallyltransferase